MLTKLVQSASKIVTDQQGILLLCFDFQGKISNLSKKITLNFKETNNTKQHFKLPKAEKGFEEGKSRTTEY